MEENPAPLVDAAWIAARAHDPSVRLVEIDVSPAAYKAGHVPGALLWNAYADLRRPDYLPVSDAGVQELVRNSGIDAATIVVFYGYGAHLGHWLLKAHGHRDVRLMDGPRDQWLAAGQAWSGDTPRFERTDYSLAGAGAYAAPMDEVRAMMGQRGTIVDTRSKPEYDGEQFWPSAAAASAGRAGHVPGAVHLPIELLRREDGTYRSSDQMRQALSERGVDRQTRVVTYCTIGNRAAQAWFALRHLLGFEDVRVYYGSWTEWGTAADTPIALPG